MASPGASRPARRRGPRRWAAALGAVLALTLPACSDDQPEPPAASTASPTPAGPLSGPALAVKIDNTAKSHPHIGLAEADVVYVEPVEGGLTRLLAVFSSRLPKEVGPVRSARESDLAILGNYGPIAFAYSGASSYTNRLLEKGEQVNLSYAASTTGYRREKSRPAPYNVVGDPETLLKRAKGSAPPKDTGFDFGPAPEGGSAAASVAVRWPASRLSFAWDATRGEYLLSTDGRKDVDPDGTQHGAASVVVQVVRTTPSKNRDVRGAATPVVQLTGKGEATVLRGGKAWQGEWSRSSLSAPTAFTTQGTPLTMAPDGPVWVLLVAPGQSVTLG
jgi:hypothetical protein